MAGASRAGSGELCQPELISWDMDKKQEPATAVRLLHIEPEDEGQRIDNYLMRQLKGVPRSRIYRILRRGEVRVNRGRIKPGYKLKAGDQIRVPPVRLPAIPDNRLPATGFSDLARLILFEDEQLLILNKPAGMAVHGGSGVSQGVIEALRATRPEAHFLELVHRLDRDTSGCLIIAKRRSMLRALHEMMRNGTIEKHYLALVMGQWEGGKRAVDAPLDRNLLRGGERLVRVARDGKPSRTKLKPVSIFNKASLMDISLDTGRTHQIRVHAAHIGHPLAGDQKYGDPSFNQEMKACGLRRLFLHAHSLAFTRPGNDNELHISAPLDAELHGVLECLESS